MERQQHHGGADAKGRGAGREGSPDNHRRSADPVRLLEMLLVQPEGVEAEGLSFLRQPVALAVGLEVDAAETAGDRKGHAGLGHGE